MKPRADASAATLRREVAPRQDKLPPAALALARLIGEAVGERLWREALAADHSEAIAQDAPQLSKPERIAEPCSPGVHPEHSHRRGGRAASSDSRPPLGERKAPQSPCYSGPAER